MPSLVRVEILDTFRAAGGVVQDDIPDLVSAKATFNVEQPDQESFECDVPVTSRVASQIAPRRVLSPVFSDGSFDEWRLNEDRTKPLGGDGMIHCVALPPIFTLAECGLYYTTGAGGVRSFAFDLVDVTPSAAITALVLGAPDCPAWIALGTIDPSVLISISGSYATPLAILFAIREAVKAAGLPCELQLRRNGTTQYLIDLVTQIGSAAAVPEIRASKQMVDYELKHLCTRQATRVIPRGPVDATGVDATLARARFKVTAVNGGTKRLTVADDAGGSGPIKYDDQFLNWFVFREKTGRTFQILHTYKATQEIELADVSDMAAHSVTAPEWITFRLTEPLTGTRRFGADVAATAYHSPRHYEVTAVGSPTLTLTDNWASGVDPIDIDNRWVDWSVRRAQLILATTFTMNVAAGRLDCASVTGVQAGDIVAIGTNAAAPYGALGSQPGTAMAVVDSVDSVNKYLYCHIRYTGVWQLGPTTFQARVFRTVGTLHLIRSSVASTNVVTVDAVGTAATTDLVEIIQPCQGTLPFYVESPSDVASFGKKIAVLGRPETGSTNLGPNSCQRTWTNPSDPPDGYSRTVTSGSPTHSQETTITRQGGKSWRVQLRTSGGGIATIKTPAAYPNYASGAGYVSVRLKLWFPTGSLTADSEITITVRRVDRNGATIATPSTWTAPSLKLGGPSHSSSLPTEQIVANDTWIDVAFNSLDISQFADDGLLVELSSSTAGDVEVILDGYQVTQTPTAPNAEPDLLVEFSEATKLLQAGNIELTAWAGAPVEFGLTAADIEAIDPTLFAEDKISKGCTVRAIDPDRAVDLSLRLMQWSPDYLRPENGQYTLATLPQLLTDLVRAGGSASASGSVTASATVIGGQSTPWDAVTGKPETFPPSDHSHVWRDILSEVAGQGPRVGVARLDSSGDADVDAVSGSPGATVQIGTLSPSQRQLMVVSGNYNNTVVFMDLVAVFERGGPTTIGAILQAEEGSPKPRTYSVSASAILLSIGGGGTDHYAVRAITLNGVQPA